MPSVSNVYKSIKTDLALEYLQDSVISGESVELLGFAVSSEDGGLDPARTITDVRPKWYPLSDDYAPFSAAPSRVTTTLSVVMDIPPAVTNNTVYITELYIYAQYKGEVFLFAICQTQTDPISYKYAPNTGYTQTATFDLTQFDGEVNVTVNMVSGITVETPLYITDEGAIAIRFSDSFGTDTEGKVTLRLEDVISEDSKNRIELGSDGKLYSNPANVSGLSGRVSNVIDACDVHDITYENIGKGYVLEDVETPVLSTAVTRALGYEGIFTYAMNTTNSTYNQNCYNLTRNVKWEGDTGLTSGQLHIDYCFPKAFYCKKLYWRHGESGTATSNMKSCDLAYSDDGSTWTTFKSITTDSNTNGAYFTFNIEDDLMLSNGMHRFWSVRNIKNWGDNSNFNCNLIQWSGSAYTITDTTSKGYVATGNLQLTDGRYISGFARDSYVISKYIVGDWEKYDFRITQKFNQVTNKEPIMSFPNSKQSLYIEEGKLHLIRNGVEYIGDFSYTYNTYYYFRILYDQSVGYTIQVSINGTSWTTEIFLNDESNFIRNKTMYLGVLASDTSFIATSGTIDLENTGFISINGENQVWNYPINKFCDTDVSVIQLTFVGTGLMGNGRTSEHLLKNTELEVDTANNMVIYDGESSHVIYSKDDGVITANYEEIDYSADNDIDEDNTLVYEKDTNKTFMYNIIYPNFFNRALKYEVIKTTYRDSNIIPTFSANTSGDFEVADSRTSSNAYSVFNGTADSSIGKWNTYWVSLKFPSKFLSKNYTIQADNVGTCNYPTAWRYEGSNDGQNWTILDSRAGEYFTSGQMKSYSFDNLKPYLYYRLIFASGVETNNNGELKKVQFLGILYDPEVDNETIMVDLSEDNALFAPNKFLEANEFAMKLNFDYTGKLSLTRSFNYSAYNTSSPYTQVWNQVGCSWSDFQNYVNNPSLEVPNGVQFSSNFGNNFATLSIGTAGALGNITNTTASGNYYANPNVQNADPCPPAFIYFVYDKPVHFDNIMITNFSNANYINNRYSVDVSNDFVNWISVVPTTNNTYSEVMGNLPIANINTPNTTASATFTINLSFPTNEYYKYVRFGMCSNNTYRPLISGLFIGGNNTVIANSETLKELVFDNIPLINGQDDGINVKVVRKDTETVYQVIFEDKVGYVKVAGSEGEVVANNTPVYADINCQIQIGTCTKAYELQCKQYLRNYIDKGYSSVTMGNPMSTKASGEYVPVLMCDTTTGTPANCWNALWDDTNAYDFANGTNETSFIIRFHERCLVENFKFRNYNGASYSPQKIKIEGSNDAYESDVPTWENVLGFENFLRTSYGTTELTESYTNGQNVISGFGAGAYVIPSKVPTYASWDSWEWTIAIETPASFSGDASRLIATPDDVYSGILVGVMSDGKFRIYLSNAGSWNIVSDGRSTSALDTSSVYVLKIGFTGSEYYIKGIKGTDPATIEASWDDNNATTFYTLSSTAKIATRVTTLMGNTVAVANAFVGAKLFTKHTYLKADGSLFWQSYTSTPIDEINIDLPTARHMFDVKLQTRNSFSYYRVTMQRTNNRILMEMIKPLGVWIDPYNKQTKSVLTWKDDFTALGNNRPLRHMTVPMGSSALTTPASNVPDNFASSIATANVFQLSNQSTGIWDTTGSGNGGVYCPLWYFAQYPIRTSVFSQYTYSNTAYLMEDFEIYSTNSTDFTNMSSSKYHKLAGSYNTADIPINVRSHSSASTYYEQILLDNSSHIGYRYNKYLISRKTNYYPAIPQMNLNRSSSDDKILPMYYTQEWKWTNVAGTQNSVKEGDVYDDPFFTSGSTSSLVKSKRVTRNGEIGWIPNANGSIGEGIPNHTNNIYMNSSCVGNPLPEVEWAYRLTYTDGSNNVHTAYTKNTIAQGSHMANNSTLYTDVDFTTSFNNIWAYEVQYGATTGYVKVSGTSGNYVAEGTPVYSEPEFTTVIANALVNTYQYNGNINYKYVADGYIDKKWTFEQGYDNQYKYTGVVDGWKYTGVTEKVYDSVPHLVANFNRNDVRRVTKKTEIGTAYPIVDTSAPNTIIGYLYDVSGTVGTACPTGLTYYTNAQDGIVAGTTDGNQKFQSVFGTTRYSYEYMYTRDTGEVSGTYLGENVTLYYDTNLTSPADSSSVQSNNFYWDEQYFTSSLGSVSFPISEATGDSDTYNINNTGLVINNNGIVSGFSQNNFIYHAVSVPARSMEYVIKIHTPASMGNVSMIHAYTQYGGLIWRLYSDGSCRIWASTNGSSWNLASEYNPSLSFEANKDYYLKLTWDSETYKFWSSENGKDWTEGGSIESQSPLYWNSGYQGLGGCSWEAYAYTGSIDLYGCYLDVDGTRIWDGVTQSIPATDKELTIAHESGVYSVIYDSTVKEIISTEDIKNEVCNLVAQKLLKLNLTDSTFSWWTWNGAISGMISRVQKEVFRLANIENSGSSIERIDKIYPYRLGEGGGDGSLAFMYDEEKNAFKKAKGGITVVPRNLLESGALDSIDLPKDTAIVYGIPNFFYGFNYVAQDTFTGSKTFKSGGVVYATSSQNVTVTQVANSKVFTGFVGVLPIPPNSSVSTTGTLYYSEN